MRQALLMLLVVALPDVTQAAEGAAFLRILPGARPLALGSAYTAVADDLNALGTNPSGLSRLGSRQAAFTHAELFAGTRYDFAGYAHPVSGESLLGGGTLGLGLARLSHNSIEGRDASGQATGGFGAADTAFSLAYARPVGGLRAGATLKYVESSIGGFSARTVAADFGLMRGAQVRGRSVMLGAAVHNVGSGLRYGSQTDELPLTVAAGGALSLGGALLLSADVKQRPHSGQVSFGLGTEYAVLPAFALRGGYSAAARSGPQDSSGLPGALNGVAMGFGLKFHKAALDYSFTPAGELGSAQRLSLSARF